MSFKMNPRAGVGSIHKRLFITHVENFGPYLKISGQLNPEAINNLHGEMYNLLSSCYAIDPSLPVLKQQALLIPGTIGLYKCNSGSAMPDGEFMRGRICNIVQSPTVAMANSLQVEVDFIDYGYSVVVSAYELLFPRQPQILQKVPPLCTQYIVLGICTEWKKSELDEVLRMITHTTLDIRIEMEYLQYKFVSMKWKEFNFAEFLIRHKNIGAPISNELVRDSFLKLLQQQEQRVQQYNSGYIANNNNINVQNNNFNSVANNNSATVLTSNVPQISTSLYPAIGMGVAPTGGDAVMRTNYGGNPMGDVMAARRSLAARIQQYQHPTQPPTPLNYVPRMPHTLGNIPSMVEGIPIQNDPTYTGLYQHQQLHGFPMPPNAPFISKSLSVPTYQIAQPTPPKQSYQPQPTPNRMRALTATFKPTNLRINMVYDVLVSFVENGPCLFSVQLYNAQENLTDMMNRIEQVDLQHLSEKPALGAVCIARYSEDNQLYRALITGVEPTACKVFYVDYGNAEMVDFDDLYEIPEEFLNAKSYAMRFTLSGHKDLEPIDESLKKAFKDLVVYKKCKLRVMPMEGPPLVQYCTLSLENKNVLDILKEAQKSRLVYAKAKHLQTNDIVEIRYIDSPKHFYVQKVANIHEFEKLMDDMFMYYNKNQVVPNELTLGGPCIVKCDTEWYRAEVMRADATAIVVRHIDFGYEQTVTKNLLSTIAQKHLKLPRQAVECCLKGFENNDMIRDTATTQFEMLAEESNRKRRSFSVKVFRLHPDGVHLVNLFTSELDVMKKLFKLSMPFDKYMNLEKCEFNVQNGVNVCGKSERMNDKGAGDENYSGDANNAVPLQKTSSLASSTDNHSVRLYGKKEGGNILNSTAMIDPSLNSRSQQPQKRQSSGPSTPVCAEWDKKSSASSSVDNRDSRSSSREYKLQTKRGQQNQQRAHNQDMLNVSASTSDRRSNASSGSGGHNKQRPGAQATNIPPRFQRQQENENRRHQTGAQTQQSGGQQRPQNAPRGFSQQRHKLSSGRSSKESSADDAQSNNSVPRKLSEEVYLPFDRPFPRDHIETPTRENISVCWWVSAHQFYTHLKARIPEFECLMQRMQEFYKNKPHDLLQLKVGSYVVSRYRPDNMIYRARIKACNHMLRKYKVVFVDIGSEYTVTSEDIWQVEKNFGDLPCMAYQCTFNGIISNVDHLQIVDRMDKYLPAGSKLSCEYIERLQEEGDVYNVNVYVDNMSLRETLKLDGVITEVCPEFRLGLLPGQQIRAKICSIKNMLNFKIQIEGCDEQIKLLCSYNDVSYVKSNPDVAGKFKKFYEGEFCIVHITDISDNKVILLNTMLPLLKQDLPTYICTYPIILESFDASVIYVDSSYRLYVHMLTTESDISMLLDEMFEYYETEGTDLECFETDTLCAAHGSDNNWYRARILKASSYTEPVEVYYIDYGNSEKLERSQLKEIDEKFCFNKSAYAIQINLPINPAAKEAHSDEEDLLLNELKVLTENETVTVKAIEMRNNRLIADLWKDGYSLVNVLKERELIKGRDLEAMRTFLDNEKPNILEYIETVDLTLEDDVEDEHLLPNVKETHINNNTSPKCDSSISVPKNEVAPDVAVENDNQSQENVEQEDNLSIVSSIKQNAVELSIPTTPCNLSQSFDCELSADFKPPASEITTDQFSNMELAVLSHCDNPTRFFVHSKDKLGVLAELQENLQIVASSLPPLMNCINGAYCISLYSVDKQWYRAKIMDAELMVIQFIDYGNTDALTDSTDIKEMSVFPDIKPLCLPCALPIKPNGTTDWVDSANAIFNDSFCKVLHYEYITRGDYERKSYIRLFIDGVDVADKLVQDGFAMPLEIVQSGENCYISHVNSITDFYIQYEKDSKALELIEIHLADNQKLPKLITCEANKIVAALFPDDKKWYRAKLLHQLSDNQGFEVLFIDYGNTSVSPECREISEEIAKLPALSKKCSLELPSNCISWSEEAEEKFNATVLGDTIFSVELREPCVDHCVVKLLIDGRDIIEDLTALCEHKEELQPLRSDIMNASFSTSTLQTSICEGSGVTMDANLSHVNSPTDFYIQFEKDTIRLDDITTTLNTLAMEALQQPVLGQLCAALFEDDGTLYRARILDLFCAESAEYRILFIDFGNEAISKDLRALPQDLMQLKPFARHCQLESVSHVLSSLAEKTFNMIIDECNGRVKVDILEVGEPASNQPDVVRLFEPNTGQNIAEKLNKILAKSVVAGKDQKQTCIVSQIISPSLFYVHLKSNSAKMDFVAKALEKGNIETMAPLRNVDLERVCSVYCAEDDCYYRGRVEEVLGGDSGCTVFLLDYGYSIQAKELRELSEELRAIPALALKCELNQIPTNVSDKELKEHFTTLMEAHFGEIFEIEDDQVDNETRLHTVKLRTANYKDLADELRNAVEKGTTHVEILSPVPTLHNCTVIHVNSPASFYIQMVADVAAIEEVTDLLLDAETDLKPFKDLRVGAVCAAQFSEDLAYYRARIVQILDEDASQCEVHYMDFGNNSVADKFRQLPPNLIQVPGYSKHCALEKSVEMGFNSNKAIKHFQELIDSRFSETFQIEVLNAEADPIICRIFYQDKNVASELQQLLKDATGDDGSSLCEDRQGQNETHIDNHPSSGVGSSVEEDAEGI